MISYYSEPANKVFIFQKHLLRFNFQRFDKKPHFSGYVRAFFAAPNFQISIFFLVAKIYRNFLFILFDIIPSPFSRTNSFYSEPFIAKYPT